ncbi:MAG: hypothetical protein AAGL89_12285 [Pseudomonadota bacterium]
MAFHDDVSLPSGQWKEVTNADVEEIRIQNRSGYQVLLQRSDDAEPSAAGGALEIGSSLVLFHERLDVAWPGASGSRVWAFCEHEATLSVSHA